MELLRCAECMLLATCLFAVTVYPTSADRQNLDRLNEISWSLRQMTNHSTSGNAGTVKEVAVVILPCKELLQGSYLRRFLNKLLMYSNVDYRVTRVSLWWEKLFDLVFFIVLFGNRNHFGENEEERICIRKRRYLNNPCSKLKSLAIEQKITNKSLNELAMNVLNLSS